MSFEEFLRIFEQILNEFIILNEYFDSVTYSRTQDYDAVFFSWVKDMARRYKNIYLSMHWATSAPLISKNQLLFDSKYRDDYFCEVKYIFTEIYTKNFRERCYSYIDNLKAIVSSFEKFNKNYSEKPDTTLNEYENDFSKWKNEITQKNSGLAIDIHWFRRTERIINNGLFFNVMFKDEFLFQLKCKPYEEKVQEKYITMDEYLDSV
ncbi:MAG: hypothetical protein ACP5QT_03345 [Brevinematia bacterium]